MKRKKNQINKVDAINKMIEKQAKLMAEQIDREILRRIFEDPEIIKSTTKK